jgi:hypothetical protein
MEKTKQDTADLLEAFRDIIEYDGYSDIFLDAMDEAVRIIRDLARTEALGEDS